MKPNGYFNTHIHQGQPIFQAGKPLNEAKAALIMLHGRGASPNEVIDLARYFQLENWAVLAPQAKDQAWYPYPFMSPLQNNQPWLSSALDTVDSLFNQIVEYGIPLANCVLFGFSQGACLALEYAVRKPIRFAGIIGLSGGLIGPPGTSWGKNTPGNLNGTPVFLSCSDHDPHIPRQRVLETAECLQRLGANLTLHFYPSSHHRVNHGEIMKVRELIRTF